MGVCLVGRRGGLLGGRREGSWRQGRGGVMRGDVAEGGVELGV